MNGSVPSVNDLPTTDCPLPTDPVVCVVPVPAIASLAVLDYRVPAELGSVAPGMRVLIPIGGRRHMGMVVGGADAGVPRDKLRDVIAVLDLEPVLGGSLLRLVEWMAEYYLAPIGEAISTALPGALRVETERMVFMEGAGPSAPLRAPGTDSARTEPRPPARTDEHALLEVLRSEGPQRVAALRKRVGPSVAQTISRLRRKGLIHVVEHVRREVAPTRHINVYEANRAVDESDERLQRRPALRKLYAYLRAHPLRRVPATELSTFPGATAKLRTLVEAGLVYRFAEESYRSVSSHVPVPDRPVTLTAAQAAAVQAITDAFATGFVPFLLLGVTGSGKTEVYLRAIASALERDRTALVLVPEISLTHQLVDRVRARFGERVAVLHSQLSTGERWDEWRRLARGEADIVIGARSSVFAPLRNLGIIIVDEEHDSAYKQADGVHYNGRDVAVMRAKLAGCPLILGSATPSMESFHNAERQRYRLLRLPERVASRPLPPVEVIDLRRAESKAPIPFSTPLLLALETNLAAGAQSLMFLNRRGFSNFLQCRACGEAVMCPHCSVSLTWHRRWRALRCHYCDYTIPRPQRCAGCGDPALTEWGTGTEQIETLLHERFPAARIVRMDRDTTQRKGSQAEMLRAWADGGFDIMVGTQMIAKGHDVPGVTLVGVLLADASLNIPDFRAGERTFQLLAQVAGRAGRGDVPGRVRRRGALHGRAHPRAPRLRGQPRGHPARGPSRAGP
jgi:primosomal protein N' (replication factor Y)